MTEKEKAKAYDEAIERAKKLYDNEIIEEIFPELKESEDDRIKKDLIQWIDEFPDIIWRGHYKKDIIAWLERQGLKPFKNEDVHKFMEYIEKEAKAYDFNLPNRSYDIYAFAKDLLVWLEKQGKTLTDKIEPRFNVGDWVVFITSGNSGNLYQVEKKENYEYTLRNIHGGSFCVSFSNEELIREWTIQDAVDGDVLVCDINKAEIGGDVEKLPNIVSTTFIFQKLINSRGYIHSYCHLYDKRFLGLQSTMYYNSFVYNISPATKEQRDTLMKAMNDAGYEWDAEKKELKKKIRFL